MRMTDPCMKGTVICLLFKRLNNLTAVIQNCNKYNKIIVFYSVQNSYLDIDPAIFMYFRE